VATLETGAKRALMSHWTTRGVGSWSPDGKYLLVGAQLPFHWNWYLVATDTSTGDHAAVTYLEEWNPGQDCAVVKRYLLSPGTSGTSELRDGRKWPEVACRGERLAEVAAQALT